MATRHQIFVGEPKIENITQQHQGLALCFYAVEQSAELQLA
jgi:hypothetical protein